MKKRTRILVALFWIFSVASLVIVERTGVKAAVPNMIMVYSKATTDTGHYSRTWNGTAWSGETTMVTNSLDSRSQVVKCARFKEECIALTSTGDPLYAQVWDGSTWSATTTLEQIIVGFYRPFDLAYEYGTDRAIVVTRSGASGNNLVYTIWNGSTWSATSSITTPFTASSIRFVELDSQKFSTSTRIAMIASDGNSDVYGMEWDGSSWSNMGITTMWDLNGGSATQKIVDVAYESASGAAIFAWANLTDSTTIYYKRWDGSSFTASSTVSVSTMSGEGHWVRLVANPYSATNTMILGIQDAAASPDLHAVFWTGSAWVLGNGGDIDISTENDLDMNFDISFLNATTSGKAWIAWGDGTKVARSRWNGSSWDSASTAGDDTAHTVLESSYQNESMQLLVYQHTDSVPDDLLEAHITNGGTTWSSDATIWGGATIVDSVGFRMDMTPSRFYTYPTFTQAAYRFFENADDYTAGTALASAQDLPATTTSPGSPFRLRLLLHDATATSTAPEHEVVLQHATKSGTCDTAFSGESYATTTASSGNIIFYDNSSVVDGVALTSNGSDPSHSGHTRQYQGYEEVNGATTTTDIAPGQDGLFDFSLKDNDGETVSNAYCFRLVQRDGHLLSTYSVIPEINTYVKPTISQADNMVFDYGGSASSTAVLTVTDVGGNIISDGNDLRIAISTSSVNMLWDTSDTMAVFGGTASGTEITSSVVSFEGGGSVLVVPVVDDFDTGDTLTISGLSFTSFNTATSSTAGTLGLFLAGGADQTYAATTSAQTVAIRGTLALEEHGAWSIGGATYDSVFTSVGSQDTSPFAFFFKSDGTKMYMLGDDFNKAFQYSLSTAWVLTGASYDNVSANTTEDSSPDGIFFKSDGTKMYMLGYASQTVYQYSLPTAWVLTGATYDSVSVSVSEVSGPIDIFFKSDGKKMYVLSNGSQTVYQYSLPNAWVLTGATYDSVSFSVNSQDTSPYAIFFKSDGTKMYMAGNTNNTVFQYTLQYPWVLTGASYDSVSVSVTNEDSTPSGIFFKSDGTKMYMAGDTNNGVFQYSVRAGQVSDQWDTLSATTSVHYRYRLSTGGENVSIATTTFNLSSITGVDASNFSYARLYEDTDKNGVVNGSTATAFLRPNGDDVNEFFAVVGTCTLYFECIDEDESDGDTSYLSAATNGDYSNSSDLVNGTTTASTIRKVRVSTIGRMTVAKTVTLRNFIKLNGVQYKATATSTASGTAYATTTTEWTSNPATGQPWTWGDLDSAKVGLYTNLAGANGAYRVTQVWLEVDYCTRDCNVGYDGTVNINGSAGTIMFATSSPYFATSTGASINHDYILELAMTGLNGGDTMTVAFTNSNATSTGATSTQAITPTGSATSVTHTADSGGATAPVVSGVTFNGGSAINLNEGTYKWASTSLLITDAEYCSSITSVTAKAYLASTTNTGTLCSENDLSCYIGVGSSTVASTCVATTTGNTCGASDTTVEYDCGFKFWYITTPTDTGDWASSIWSVSATATDDGALTGNATNTGQSVEINTLSAFSVSPATIVYGTVAPGADTGAVNQTTTVTNTGNTNIDPRLSGTAMSSVDDTILVDQQEYSADPFTWSAGTNLSSTPTTLDITLPAPTATTSAITDTVLWGVGVPSGKRTGDYTGTNTLEI